MADLSTLYVTTRKGPGGAVRHYWQKKGHPLVRLPADPFARANAVWRLNSEARFDGRQRNGLRMIFFLEGPHERLVRTQPSTMPQVDFWAMARRAGGRCELSGITLNLDRVPGVSEARCRPWSPSVDRINPAQGYTAANSRLVCLAANLARNEWPDAVLIELARGVTANQSSAKV